MFAGVVGRPSVERPSVERLDVGSLPDDHADDYRYVHVGSCYVNRRLRLARVWRVLWEQQSEFLGSEGKRQPGNGLAQRLPVGLLRLLRAGLASGRFVASRLGARRDELRVPANGEIALRRRSGAVKVLDLERGRVATVMTGAASSEKLRRRLALAREVERYPFAPSVQEVALERGWFAEEFLAGANPTAFQGCHQDFEAVYQPLLLQLVRAEPPRRVPRGQYVRSLVRDMLAPDALAWRLPGEGPGIVTRFVEALATELTTTTDQQAAVPLVLSHGDFFSGNVIRGPEGRAWAVDWAHLGRRSPLHDLYYVVMNHCVRVLPPEARRDRLRAIIVDFREALAREDPARFAELEPALTDTDAWRRLFYLECIHAPLQACDDPEDRYLRAMLQRIEWFEAYERALRPDGAGSGPGR
jgi:hypothetical protein